MAAKSEKNLQIDYCRYQNLYMLSLIHFKWVKFVQIILE